MGDSYMDESFDTKQSPDSLRIEYFVTSSPS